MKPIFTLPASGLLRVVCAACTAAGLMGAGCSKDTGTGGTDATRNQAKYIKDVETGEVWEVDDAKIAQMFPMSGAERASEYAVNPKTGRRTVMLAVKCPKDGTVFVRKTSSTLEAEPCPKCRWRLIDIANR